MNKGIRIWSVAFFSFWLHGCVSFIGVTSEPSEDQVTVFESGTEAIVSSRTSIVTVRPESQVFQSTVKPTFVVTVLNRSEGPVVFSTENITAEFNESAVQVFSYDELVAEVKKEEAIQAFAAALAGVGRAMNAANAGHQYHYGSVNTSSYGNSYSPYGSSTYSGTGYGTYSGYSYDPAAAQQAQALAQAQTNQDFERISNASESALAQLQNTILRKQTVFPSAWYGGFVKLEPVALAEGENTLRLLVEFGGEMHPFVFTLTKIQQ